MKKRELFICIFTLVGVLVGLVFTIIFVDNSVLSAVITTLIGSAITFLIGRMYEIINNGFSHFTGYYRDEIFSRDDPSKIIKRAKFRIIDKGGNNNVKI